MKTIVNSYMNYWDGVTELPSGHDSKKQYGVQLDKVNAFATLCKGKNVSNLSERYHLKQASRGRMSWSLIEQFRYLEHLYRTHPEYFTGTPDQINSIRKEFYDNQPIVLTLPFKKPTD